MKRFSIAILGLLTALAALPAVAQPGGRGMMLRRCLRAANVQLTVEQRDKLRTLRDKNRLEMDKIRPQIRKLRVKALKALADTALSDAQVRKVFQDVQDQRIKLMRKFSNGFIQLRHILTPEQLKKIADTPACLEPGKAMRRGGPGCTGRGCRHHRGMMRGKGRGPKGGW